MLTADGRVSRVLAGLDGSVDDLRLALVEAGGGRVGTIADQVRLLCYGFDPVRGVYTPAVMGILRVCGATDGAGARRRHPAAAPPHAPDRRTRGGAMNDQPLPRFEFFPVQASVEASRTDLIYYSFVGISVLISLIVVALIVTFSFRYRRGTKAKRGPMPRLLRHEFEAGWVSATFFAFLFMFWWGASNTLSAWLPPEDGLEIHVIGKQWMWKTEHPNGAREINELHVPVGRPVRLVMTSQDVIHDFYVPAFRMKKDVLPGRFTEQGFTATRIGEYRLECAEYCGTQHSHMTGRIIVMRQEDYARWAAAQPAGRRPGPGRGARSSAPSAAPAATRRAPPSTPRTSPGSTAARCRSATAAS